MTRLFTCLFLLLGSSFAWSQELYEIDVEERNNSIVITGTASDMIAKGNYESAAKILESVLKNDPTFHPAYVAYYNAIRGNNFKTDELVEALKQGLEIFEEDDELAYYLGNMFQSERRFEEAIKAYSEAIAYSKINGEDYPIVWAYHFNRGNCHLKTAQYEKALVDYNYALELSPDNGDILTNRGTTLYQLKQKNKACQDWKEALNFGSKAAIDYVNRYCK